MTRRHYARSIVGALAIAVVLVLVGTGSAAADLTDSNETVEITDQNDSVILDVEFNDSFLNDTSPYNGSSYALVELYNENGSLAGSTNITVDETDMNSTQIAVDSDTIWFTTSISNFDEDDVGNLTVHLADSGQGINDTAVSVDDAGLFGSGLLGGASKTQILAGVVAILIGVVAFRRIDG